MSLSLVTDSTAALAPVEAVLASLAEMEDVSQAADLADKAEVIRVYAKKARLGLEAQNHAALVKVLAQRRVGELLRDDPEYGPGKSNREFDLGVSQMQLHRWQRLADLDESDIAEAAEKATAAQKEFRTSLLVKPAPPSPHKPGPLPEGTFATVVADPPWQYGNKATRGAAEDHYSTMTIEELCALDVVDQAAEDAHLYLWTTNNFLREAFDVVKAWGFEYKTCLTWVKPQIGMGNYFRSSTEHVLFGVRGRLPIEDRTLRNWFKAPRGQHSTKPDMFYDLVEMASPGPYLEIFARRRRMGWTVWGDEA